MTTPVVEVSFAILFSTINRFNTSLGGHMDIDSTRRRPNLDDGRFSNKVPARFVGYDCRFTTPLRTPPKRLYNFPTMPHSLSPLIRLGTSTWTYEGWQCQVYKREYAKSKFAQECLGEYCQYHYNDEPLFRTVGNDSPFYRPPTANQLRRYLSQIPEDFQMCFKVWEEITIPSYAKQPR
jgi:hypothetical protein